MTDKIVEPTTSTDQTTEVSKPVAENSPEPKKDIEAKKKEDTISQETGEGGWGWGFDVNAVAGNIGGFFATNANEDEDEDEDEDVEEEEEEEENGPADDLGKTAANIASAATVELEIASKAAQQTIGKAAEELGKGWGTLNSFLDDMLAAKPDGDQPDENENDTHTQFHTMFPQLEKEDEVVDHFKCTLLQKYRCYLNNATPEKNYPLRGKLFVSTAHIAMYITDDGGAFGGKPFGIAIPFTDVGKILKGAKSMLKLVTTEQISYIFAGFESDSHFSGALSLLEHMKASSESQPPSNEDEVIDNKESAPTS